MRHVWRGKDFNFKILISCSFFLLLHFLKCAVYDEWNQSVKYQSISHFVLDNMFDALSKTALTLWKFTPPPPPVSFSSLFISLRWRLYINTSHVYWKNKEIHKKFTKQWNTFKKISQIFCSCKSLNVSITISRQFESSNTAYFFTYKMQIRKHAYD